MQTFSIVVGPNEFGLGGSLFGRPLERGAIFHVCQRSGKVEQIELEIEEARRISDDDPKFPERASRGEQRFFLQGEVLSEGTYHGKRFRALYWCQSPVFSTPSGSLEIDD